MVIFVDKLPQVMHILRGGVVSIGIEVFGLVAAAKVLSEATRSTSTNCAKQSCVTGRNIFRSGRAVCRSNREPATSHIDGGQPNRVDAISIEVHSHRHRIRLQRGAKWLRMTNAAIYHLWPAIVGGTPHRSASVFGSAIATIQ